MAHVADGHQALDAGMAGLKACKVPLTPVRNLFASALSIFFYVRLAQRIVIRLRRIIVIEGALRRKRAGSG